MKQCSSNQKYCVKTALLIGASRKNTGKDCCPTAPKAAVDWEYKI